MSGMHIGWRVDVDFLDAFQSTGAVKADWDKVSAAIRRLKWVRAAWIDHTCVAELEMETSSPKVAGRRAEATIAKIRSVLERYGRGHQ